MASQSYDDILRRAKSELTKAQQQQLAAELAESATKSQDGSRCITDLRGLGKKVWQGVDAERYVAEERQSWDG